LESTYEGLKLDLQYFHTEHILQFGVYL